MGGPCLRHLVTVNTKSAPRRCGLTARPRAGIGATDSSDAIHRPGKVASTAFRPEVLATFVSRMGKNARLLAGIIS